MKIKKLFLIWVFLLAVIWAFIIYWPRGSYFIGCDVGQGDALLITSGFNQVLIDGGPNKKVLSCLSENMPFWDKKIELMVNTHPEADHYTGLKSVIESYQVDYFATNNLINPSGFFEQFRKKVLQEDIPVYTPEKGDKLRVGDLYFQVLWPEKQQDEYLAWEKSQQIDQQVLGAKTRGFNNRSIVLYFQKEKFSALLTGDIEDKVEQKLVIQGLPKVDLLKIPHHGSKYSTTEELLQTVQPQQAVISVGKNPWGHPTEEVLQRLKKKGIKIFRTDQSEVKFKI